MLHCRKICVIVSTQAVEQSSLPSTMLGRFFFEAVNNAQSETNLVCAIHCRVVQYTEKSRNIGRSYAYSRIMEVCFITACTLAAVLCTRQSVQSADTDEVSNIVVMIVFNK